MPMNADPLPMPQQIASVMPSSSPARKVFFRQDGLRAGWRFLIFALLWFACVSAIRLGFARIPPLRQILQQVQSGTLTPTFEFIFETTAIEALFLVTFVMAKIDKRSFWSYGLPLKGAFGRLFWQGVVWGLVMESIEMFTIYALHGFSFGSLALSGFTLVKYAVAWALVFVLVGIFEEFTFRGYAQFSLGEGIGFWPSAILLSAMFGAVHLGNAGEGWIGALSVLVFGLFACFTLRRTGSLWFAIGLHAAGDYAETFIYSVPDSGLKATGHLLNSCFHGPRWLTGGTIGPEGSAVDFLVLVIAFVVFAWLYPARKADDAEQPVLPLRVLQPSPPIS
jgi:membrane protease YdiL (CAAX protease family)